MQKQITLKQAISIGIGGMVGGGIFAVLGLAVSFGKGGTPLSFLIAGFLALITSYSYVKLSIAYPDSGGTVKFINQGFGKTIFAGSINNLLWISYIIMLALYASAFGSYASNFIAITHNHTVDFHIYASLIVTIATAINYYSITTVSKIESYAVGTKIIILLSFIGIGLCGLLHNQNISQLTTEHWASPIKLIIGGLIIFIAYEGFELIANAAPNIKNPTKNIPRAYYYAILFVIFLYIMIAIVTIGSLSFDQITTAQDYVLAQAARPMLGEFGFIVITITALISTFSAINASLYGGSHVSYEIAQDGEITEELTRKLWNQPSGLFLTAIATLIAVNVIKLESIAATGSIGFILIFAIVNLVAFKLSKKINAAKSIPLLGFIACINALILLIMQQYSSNRTSVLIAVGIITFCFIIESIYQKYIKK